MMVIWVAVGALLAVWFYVALMWALRHRGEPGGDDRGGPPHAEAVEDARLPTGPGSWAYGRDWVEFEADGISDDPSDTADLVDFEIFTDGDDVLA
jgi:hypothetical protein